MLKLPAMRLTSRFALLFMIFFLFLAARPALAAGMFRLEAGRVGNGRDQMAAAQTATATLTPQPTLPKQPTLAPAVGLLPTPGRPAKNPATIGDFDLLGSMVKGGIIAAILFGCVGLYLAIRGFFRDR